jgi:hypothetical protein
MWGRTGVVWDNKHRSDSFVGILLQGREKSFG